MFFGLLYWFYSDSPGGYKRQRLDGGGRKVNFPERDNELVIWIEEARRSKLPVSRKLIREKAAKLFVGTLLKV